MQRVAFLLKVKRDWLDEYKEIHKDVWPEMQQAIAEAGWHNYSLFMREDGDFELDRLPIHPLQRGQVRCSPPPNRFFRLLDFSLFQARASSHDLPRIIRPG
jgi:hypothetical protein